MNYLKGHLDLSVTYDVKISDWKSILVSFGSLSEIEKKLHWCWTLDMQHESYIFPHFFDILYHGKNYICVNKTVHLNFPLRKNASISNLIKRFYSSVYKITNSDLLEKVVGMIVASKKNFPRSFHRSECIFIKNLLLNWIFEHLMKCIFLKIIHA